MVNRDLETIFAAAHVDPQSFEAELGLLCHKWILVKGIDHVIEGLDNEVEALEGRRDLEATPRSPPAE